MRILARAYPDQRQLQQTDDDSDHFLLCQRLAFHIAGDTPAYPWQRRGEFAQLLIFRRIAYLVPLFMVAILLASARIAGRRLDMAVFVRTYPDIFVGGRY